MFFGEVCEKFNSVVSIDSTAGMMNFRDTDFDGKIQHTIVSMSFKENAVPLKVVKYTDAQDFSTIRITERASSWNTATGNFSWWRDWRLDVRMATKDVLGREIEPVIGMVKVDCALQYPTGMIMALRQEGMIDSSRTYHNIAHVLLLRHESRSEGCKDDSAEYKRLCILMMRDLKKYAPFAIKWCNVHVYLAQRDGFKNMKNKPFAIRQYYSQVNRMYHNLDHDFFMRKNWQG